MWGEAICLRHLAQDTDFILDLFRISLKVEVAICGINRPVAGLGSVNAISTFSPNAGGSVTSAIT